MQQTIHEKTLNTKNPMYGDTFNIFPYDCNSKRPVGDVSTASQANGWTVVRFVANNPVYIFSIVIIIILLLIL
jgi:hypothetical protein